MFITKHAYKRAHQRMGISKNALARIVNRVESDGTVICSDGDMTQIEYGNNRFILRGNYLVTIL